MKSLKQYKAVRSVSSLMREFAAARLRLLHLALLLPLAALLVWIAGSGRSVRSDPSDVLAALRKAQAPHLPTARSLGASAATEPARYNRETLYEYINGAAEAYIALGFTECVTSIYIYERPDGPAAEFAVDVFRFESEEGAKRRCADEAPSPADPLPGFSSGAVGEMVLVAAAGRDLLKITSLTPGAASRETLLALAQAWRKDESP